MLDPSKPPSSPGATARRSSTTPARTPSRSPSGSSSCASSGSNIGSRSGSFQHISHRNSGGSTPVRQPSAKGSISLDKAICQFLEDHVLFRDLDPEFVGTLPALMQTRVYGDGDYVIRKGEVGRAMFFVLKGEVEVVSEDGETIINVMREESFFGEIGVLFSVPRTATCRAKGRCILLTLTKDAMKRAIEGHPQAAFAITQIAEERFTGYMKAKEDNVHVDFGEELQLGMTQSDLKKVPLFRDCEVGFLHMLALSLEPVEFSQGELIVRTGDLASEMFFVVRGTAEVFSETDGTVYATFGPGSFFGEVGIFFQVKRTASVRCTSNQVTLFRLSKSDLDELLKQYPEIAEKVGEQAKIRFQYNEEREKAKHEEAEEVETEVEVVRERLKNVPLFKDGSVGFLHQLALSMVIRVYEPSSTIIKKDEVGRSMFFVIDGSADVVSDDGVTVYAEMGPSSYFGEVALFFEVNRTATVRARTRTTMFELSKEALWKVLDQHPALKSTMQVKARENYELFQSRQREVKKLSDRDRSQYDLVAISERLKKSYNEGELIVRKGEIASEMYFVVQGKAEIISDDETVVFDTINSGGFFGEVGLLRGIARTASVRAASSPTCDILVLTAMALQSVLEEYPESYQLIALEADKRFKLTEERKLATESALHGGGNITAQYNPLEEPFGNVSVRLATGPGATMGDGGTIGLDGGTTDKKVAKRKGLHYPTAFFQKKPAKKDVEDKSQKSIIGSLFTKKKDRKTDDLALSDEKKSEIEHAEGKDTHPEKLPQVIGKVFKSMAAGFRRNSKTKVAPSPRSSVTKPPSIRQSRVVPPSHRTITNILDLYDDELHKILVYLSPDERLSLRLICRKWGELLRRAQRWDHLNFAPMFRTATGKQVLMFCGELAGEHLKSINLSNCWRFEDDDLLRLSESCPNVQFLGISNCWKLTDRGLTGVALNMSHLRDLDVSYCGQITGSGAANHRWTGLQSLNLTFCKHLHDEQLEKILCRTSDIATLRLRRCTRLSDFGLFLIVRYCRYIKSLDVSDCEQFSDKCLKWISSSCYDLEDLNLTFCTQISNAGMYDLSLGCQRFQRLNFAHCVHITDAALVFFSDSFTYLRSLSLRRCRKITDATVKFLGHAAPNLKFLDVTGCPKITRMAETWVKEMLPRCRLAMDLPPDMRGVVQPGYGDKPKAVELKLNM
ncbi:hypothetical protein HK104_003166, partial [Borealophlyctis nickersoniae]